MTRLPARSAAALASDADRAELRRSDGERSLETQLRRLRYPPHVIEHRFDSARRWRLDFAWPELMVAVEIEGGAWSSGRHVRGRGFEDDCVKYSNAGIAGWTVIRVTTEMVDDGRAIDLIERALAAARIWRSTMRGTGCWLWEGWRGKNGYGLIVNRETPEMRSVHRVIYETAFGPIPVGLTIDHTCHNGSGCTEGNACPHRRCVRPDHLEAVTRGENIRRAQSTGNRCRLGHARSRTPGGRWWCPDCQRSRRAARKSQ